VLEKEKNVNSQIRVVRLGLAAQTISQFYHDLKAVQQYAATNKKVLVCLGFV
jgi:hypothetical protein